MLSSGEWVHERVRGHGARIHCVRSGKDGPLFLMVHGFPEFWYSWRHQLREFGSTHRAVAMDLRGYGESDKPPGREAYRMRELTADLREVIRHYGDGPAVLAGHDWGGAVAWNFAHRHPEVLSHLIILNCPHPKIFVKRGLKSPRQLMKSWYMGFFQIPWLPEWVLPRGNARLIGEMFRTSAANPEAFTEEDLLAFRESALRPGALRSMLAYYRNLRSPSDSAGDQGTKTIAVPTLMLWGEKDVALGKDLTRGTEEYAPDLTLRFLPECGHWTQQDRPEDVNRHIREFLTKSK